MENQYVLIKQNLSYNNLYVKIPGICSYFYSLK